MANQPIIHIGLGKTGTTFIQEILASKFLGLFGYLNGLLNEDLKREILEHRERILKKKKIKKVILPKKTFFSLETLIAPSGWCPSHYNYYAKSNYLAFGENAKILITIRDPKYWLRSIYLRNFEKNNFLYQSGFFTKKNIQQINNDLTLEHCKQFDLYLFNLNKLNKIYKNFFQKVFFLKYEDILNVNKWEKIFEKKINKESKATFFDQKSKIIIRKTNSFDVQKILKIKKFFQTKEVNIKKFFTFYHKIIDLIYRITSVEMVKKLKFSHLVLIFFKKKKFIFKKKFMPKINQLSESYKNFRSSV